MVRAETVPRERGMRQELLGSWGLVVPRHQFPQRLMGLVCTRFPCPHKLSCSLVFPDFQLSAELNPSGLWRALFHCLLHSTSYTECLGEAIGNNSDHFLRVFHVPAIVLVALHNVNLEQSQVFPALENILWYFYRYVIILYQAK